MRKGAPRRILRIRHRRKLGGMYRTIVYRLTDHSKMHVVTTRILPKNITNLKGEAYSEDPLVLFLARLACSIFSSERACGGIHSCGCKWGAMWYA